MSKNSLSHKKEQVRNGSNNDNPTTSHAIQKIENSKLDLNLTNVNERTCWICFCTDEDNHTAAWVKPCKCRGTMQWVHQNCLYRWIDEKQKGNYSSKPVMCPQCQTEYIIVSPPMGKLTKILENCDYFIKRTSPFLAAGIFIGSLYWSALTFGAVTYMQVVGYRKGLEMLEDSDILTLLIGLPAIPIGLLLGRMIQWENTFLALLRNRRSLMRNLPFLNLIITCPEEENEILPAQSSHLPPFSEQVSGTRIFCGALLLPTISIIVGRLLFSSIENRLSRTFIGGLTFVTVKGLLKVYLIDRRCTHRKKRRFLDYTEENLQLYGGDNGALNSARLFLESSSSFA